MKLRLFVIAIFILLLCNSTIAQSPGFLGSSCSSSDDCRLGLICNRGTCMPDPAFTPDPNALTPPPPPPPQSPPSQPSLVPLEIAQNWRAIAIGAAIIMVILAALAFMFGQSFEMPELKAWASTEIVQAFVTVIIIISFTGIITLIEALVTNTVNGSNLADLRCTPATPNCAIAAANAYLGYYNSPARQGGLIGLATSKSREIIQSSSDATRQAYANYGGYSSTLLFPLPLLEFTASYSPGAGYLMHVERYNSVLEYFGNIISVLRSQKFFIENFSFSVGPVILLIGIVARSFFMTRRLGGLLIAAGIGIMYVFPLMYVFNWLTLNITLFGDSIITPRGGTCPASCLLGPPAAYTSGPGGRAFRETELPVTFSPDQRAAIVAGTVESATADNQLFYSCNINTFTARARDPPDPASCPAECRASPYPSANPRCSNIDTKIACLQPIPCPMECRELPYPMTPECSDQNIKIACNLLNDRCKNIRNVDITTNPDRYNAPLGAVRSGSGRENPNCPIACRSIPPLRGNCISTDASNVNCVAGRDYCKFLRVNESRMASIANPRETIPGNPIPADNCEKDVAVSDILGNRPNRVDTANRCTVPTPISTVNEPYDQNAAFRSCFWILPSQNLLDTRQCNGCIFVPEEYTLNPPIYRSCSDLCSIGALGPPKISPAEFTRRTQTVMVGREEIKSAAALILPAYILPLLNIVVTLMFIRSFSQILGGDVDIPGLTKII